MGGKCEKCGYNFNIIDDEPDKILPGLALHAFKAPSQKRCPVVGRGKNCQLHIIFLS